MRVLLTGLLLAVLAGCGTDVVSPEASPAAAWEVLPPSPLSPRHAVLQVAVGQEALLLGGQVEPLCPPGASCVAPPSPLRDAAAYDVKTGRWRPLAPAPTGVSAGAAAVASGDTVFVLTSFGEPAFLGYDVARDSWQVLPAPPAEGQLRLVAAGDRVIAYAWSHEHGARSDWLYTPTERRWSVLPPDPLAPSFDRAMVWTGEDMVLVAPRLTAQPGGESGPSWLRAARLDLSTSTWTPVPERQQVISGELDPVWTGSAVLYPAAGGADGGETNGYGRSLPFGGFLDPRTGSWSPLPPTDRGGFGGGLSAGSPDHVVRDDQVLDVRGGRWIDLPPPPAAGERGATSVWVDGALLVWGGGDPDTGELVAAGARWTPPGP